MIESKAAYILNGLQAVGSALGDRIVSVTKAANDVVGSTAVDAFMDSAKGIGHRIVHGHSLDNIPAIFNKFGMSGVGDYFSHGLRDVMSPHGMPIPFADEIAKTLGLRPMEAVNWLCFNIGDVVSGGLSVGHSTLTYIAIQNAVAAGFMPPSLAISTAVGSAIKIGLAISSTNPVSLICGVTDLGMLVWGLSPAFTMGHGYFVKGAALNAKPIILGGFWGAGAAAAVGGVLHGFTADDWIDWRERLMKLSFAGAIGGAFGVGSSAISTNPIVISSSAVAGYVFGDWLYERIQAGFQSKGTKDSDDFLPDFLADEYCPAD